MSDSRPTTGSPRRIAALSAAAVGAWLAFGSGIALAAPAEHAAATAASHTRAASPAHARHAAARGQVRAAHPSAVRAGDHVTHGTAGTSGDPTQPQPVSKADQNSGGANGQCPGGTYCSTRDGSPSGNGNGGGQATGKPCAGCVGKADNKNPPGQETSDPRGTFPNNGYECDNNNGIGKTNPAHTGCTGPTTTCPEGEVMNSETGECGPPPCDASVEDCGNDGGCDAATEDCGGTPPPPACVPSKANGFCSDVEGNHHSRTPGGQKPPTEVLGEKVVRTPGALPFTGAGGLGLMITAAAVALAAGTATTLAARRRRVAVETSR